MRKEAMIVHLKAHSAVYDRDAHYWALRGDPELVRFSQGKSEAFATAASWLEEMED